MHALRLHDFGDMRWEEVPPDPMGPTDVRVSVVAVQPSVTEAMLSMGSRITLHDHLAARVRRGPTRFGGHEFAGIVTEVGDRVSGWQPGDRVTAIETITSDPLSGTGSVEYLGFTVPGAFATEVVVPAANLVRVPHGVSAGEVAAVQPLAGVLHAQAALQVCPGESVLVVGCGVMGLLAIQVARHGNAGQVIAVGRSRAKRELAARLGADVVLDSTVDDIPTAVRDLTAGHGADAAIETAGGPPAAGLAGDSTLEWTMASCRRGGRLLLEAVYDEDSHFPFTTARTQCLTVINPSTGAGGYSPAETVFDHALRLIARGDVDVDTLVTHRRRGLEHLVQAVRDSADKSSIGAVNPPQVFTDEAWDTTERENPC